MIRKLGRKKNRVIVFVSLIVAAFILVNVISSRPPEGIDMSNSVSQEQVSRSQLMRVILLPKDTPQASGEVVKLAVNSLTQTRRFLIDESKRLASPCHEKSSGECSSIYAKQILDAMQKDSDKDEPVILSPEERDVVSLFKVLKLALSRYERLGEGKIPLNLNKVATAYTLFEEQSNEQ